MDIYLENDSLFDRADTICLSEHLPKLSSYYVDESFRCFDINSNKAMISI